MRSTAFQRQARSAAGRTCAKGALQPRQALPRPAGQTHLGPVGFPAGRSRQTGLGQNALASQASQQALRVEFHVLPCRHAVERMQQIVNGDIARP